MDRSAQLEVLNAALVLQSRSALQYTLTVGTLFGFEYRGSEQRAVPRSRAPSSAMPAA